MGSAFSMKKCPNAVEHSVVTFSDDLILKLTEGIEPKPLTEEEHQKAELEDYEWFQKMKCIDESHSIAYGLTESSVEALFAHIQRLSTPDTKHAICDNKEVISCYESHSKNPICCEKPVKEYVDCVEGAFMSGLGIKHKKAKEEKQNQMKTKKTAKKKK